MGEKNVGQTLCVTLLAWSVVYGNQSFNSCVR